MGTQWLSAEAVADFDDYGEFAGLFFRARLLALASKFRFDTENSLPRRPSLYHTSFS